jgi:hypothetical protein
VGFATGIRTDNYFIDFDASGSAQNAIRFFTGTGSLGTGTERARIDSSGRLLVGTSTARANYFGASVISPGLQIEAANSSSAPNRFLSVTYGSNDSNDPIIVLGKHRSTSVGGLTIVQNGDYLGRLFFQGSDGTNFIGAAAIHGEVDGTPGTNDMPGRLVFSTTADGASSPTERMRITNSGQVRIGSEVGTNNYSFGVELSKDNNVLALIDTNPSNSGSRVPFTIRTGTYSSSDTTSLYANFIRGDGTQRGQIRSNGATSVAYESASDYRLKENVVPLINATARLQQLKPYRFNFIDDGPDRVVDGFFAHEVQEVIPEAAGGTKDAEDADGNPIYQGIDQSKLVPLLTAALQEALAEIESLKARVTALEL